MSLDIKLSPREIQVLQGIVNGITYEQIAGELGISVRTVKNYVGAIRRKCGRQTVAASVALAVALDMVEVLYDGN